MNQNTFNCKILSVLSSLAMMARQSYEGSGSPEEANMVLRFTEATLRELKSASPVADPLEGAGVTRTKNGGTYVHLRNSMRPPKPNRGFRHKPYLGVIKDWAVVDGRVTGWFAYQHGGPGAGDYQQDDMVATRRIVHIAEYEQYALLETENGVYTLIDELGQSRRSDERNV